MFSFNRVFADFNRRSLAVKLTLILCRTSPGGMLLNVVTSQIPFSSGGIGFRGEHTRG